MTAKQIGVSLRVKDQASRIILDLAKVAMAAAVEAAVGAILDDLRDAGLVVADASQPHTSAEPERAERVIRKRVRKLAERNHDDRLRNQG